MLEKDLLNNSQYVLMFNVVSKKFVYAFKEDFINPNSHFVHYFTRKRILGLTSKDHLIEPTKLQRLLYEEEN